MMTSDPSPRPLPIFPDPAGLSTARFALLVFGALSLIAAVGATSTWVFMFA